MSGYSKCWFTDSRGIRRLGEKRYSKAEPGTAANPTYLSEMDFADTDNIIDRDYTLRADSVPGVPSIHPLPDDRTFRIFLAARRVTLAVVRKDRIASPVPVQDRDYSDQFPAFTNAGQTVVTDSLESDNWQTANFADNCDDSITHTPCGALERDETDLRLWTGCYAANDGTRAARVAHLADCILSAIAELNLLVLLPE